VGGHVDHLLLHRVATRVAAPRLRFYEDRPYALVRGMVERRLRALGEDSPEQGVRDRLRFAADFARAGYVRSYLSPLDALRAPRLRWRRPRAEERAEGVRWKSELVVENPETQALASQALACYRSQWPELFSSLAQLERQTRRYSKRLGPSSGYVERLWHAA
jgi:LmbE family N-acetylglucosaminyl deacetylase